MSSGIGWHSQIIFGKKPIMTWKFLGQTIDDAAESH